MHHLWNLLLVWGDVGGEDALLRLLPLNLERRERTSGTASTHCRHVLLIESSRLDWAVMTRTKARILIVISVHGCIHRTVLSLHLGAERLLLGAALVIRRDYRWGFQR